MFILYRYLLRQFSQIFVICFSSLLGLYIMIDAFGNLDEFMSYGDRHGGALPVIARYYAYRSVSFFDATSGIIALISAMFTLALFQRYNELTALLAAGIPKWRVLKPVIAAVATISLVAAGSRELLIPAVRDKLCLDAHDMAGEKAHELKLPKWDNSTDILISGKESIAKTQQIREPVFRLPPSLDAPFNQLQAANAFFRPADGDHPAGYLLVGMTQPKDLAKRASLPRNGPKVIFTPRDYRWLKTDECFVASDITFEQLVGTDNWRHYASFLELVRSLHNPSLVLGGDAVVAIHARPLQPVLDLTLLFLGLPLVLRRNTENMFVAIGLCLGVVVAFMLSVYAAQSLRRELPDSLKWLGGRVDGRLAAGAGVRAAGGGDERSAAGVSARGFLARAPIGSATRRNRKRLARASAAATSSIKPQVSSLTPIPCPTHCSPPVSCSAMPSLAPTASSRGPTRGRSSMNRIASPISLRWRVRRRGRRCGPHGTKRG